MSETPAAGAEPRADEMPMLGLGTWENDDHDQCVESVKTAIEMGYRHVDTAQAYRNEDAVGEGIAAAAVDRDELFLATKVWISNLAHDDVISTAEDSLDRLGTDYVDLLYVHWPAGEYDPEETLPALDDLHDRGLIENVGLSNFEPHHLDRAGEVLDAPIFANQVEMHPLLQQDELRQYAAETDLNLVAYSPLVRGDIFDVPVVQDIAEKHGVSEPQISLAWLREKDVTAIPKATGAAHLQDNLDSLAVDLDAEDVERIDGIDETTRVVHPDFGPDAWD